jgi:hypothetical protein
MEHRTLDTDGSTLATGTPEMTVAQGNVRASPPQLRG